jgi:hypothetical protein
MSAALTMDLTVQEAVRVARWRPAGQPIQVTAYDHRRGELVAVFGANGWRDALQVVRFARQHFGVRDTFTSTAERRGRRYQIGVCAEAKGQKK